MNSASIAAKKAVESKIGECITVDDSFSHDWVATRRLLSNYPEALHFTGKELDACIARKMFVPWPDAAKVVDILLSTAMHGPIEVFCRLESQATTLLEQEDYMNFAYNAMQTDMLDVLMVPNVTAAIKSADSTFVACCIDEMHCTAPTLDYFLSNVKHDGCDINSNIHFFIERGSHGIVKCLHKHGMIDPFTVIDDDEGKYTDYDEDYTGEWTPLWHACNHGHISIVQLFLSDPRIANVEVFSHGIENAIRNNHISVVEMMLQTRRVQMDDECINSYVSIATNRGRTEIMWLLMHYIDAESFKPSYDLVVDAASNGYTAIALMFLSHRVCRRELLKDPETITKLRVVATYECNTQILEALAML